MAEANHASVELAKVEILNSWCLCFMNRELTIAEKIVKETGGSILQTRLLNLILYDWRALGVEVPGNPPGIEVVGRLMEDTDGSRLGARLNAFYAAMVSELGEEFCTSRINGFEKTLNTVYSVKPQVSKKFCVDYPQLWVLPILGQLFWQTHLDKGLAAEVSGDRG